MASGAYTHTHTHTHTHTLADESDYKKPGMPACGRRAWFNNDGPLSTCNKKLSGPSREALDVCGQFIGKLQRNSVSTTQDIYVIRGLHTPLLERPAIEALQLLTVPNGIQTDDIVRSFQDYSLA